MLKSILTFSLLILSVEFAHAVCSSPVAGVTGQMQWISADSKVKYCDNTNWITTFENVGVSCAAGDTGKIEYTAGSLTYCNGTNRIGMNGSLSLGACSNAGQFQWDSTYSVMKLCSGTTWYALAPLLPTYIGQDSGGRVNSTTCTTNKPSGLAEDDLMLIAIYQNGGATGMTAPSGFTQIGSTVTISGYHLFKFSKVATAADVAASTFSFTRAAGIGSECGLMIVHFRNVNTTNPVQAFDINSGSGTTTTYDSLTAVYSNSYVVAIGESTGSTPTNPSGYTTIQNYASYLTRFSGKALPSPGATGAATASQSSAPWVGSHILLNPKIPTGTVSVLAHFNGADASTTFTNEAGSNLSRIGTSVQISTTQNQFGGASAKLDATDAFSSLYLNSTVFNHNDGDLTVEGWYYIDSYGNSSLPPDVRLFTLHSNLESQSYISVGMDMSGYLDVRVQAFDVDGYYFSNGLAVTPISTDAWHHIAVTRTGSLYSLYVDGTLAATATRTHTLGENLSLTIGNTGYGFDGGVDGWVDEFRVTRGLNRYPSNFTPAIVPFSYP